MTHETPTIGTSHGELMRLAYAAAITPGQHLHVQYRRQGVAVCAEVLQLFEHQGREWVKLSSPLDGVCVRPCASVQVCEGQNDGFCICSKNEHFFQAGVVAPPESPIFGTPSANRCG